MEKLKEKHNHKLTDLLKVAMFSLVMTAPFISIGVRCGYVMWNKNAKDSYSGNQNEVLELNNISDLKVGTTYNISNFYFNTTEATSNNQIVCSELNYNQNHYEGYILLVLWKYSGSTTTYLNFNVDGVAIATTQNTTGVTLKFVYESTTLTQATYELLNKKFNYINDSNSNQLDNAFSYSVNQISNDPVFNWTRNTGIYTPINAMVEGLEIENDTLQILLAYWSLMTAVYIVFDLIIFCFTKITHFING